jgi:hypothetical protein
MLESFIERKTTWSDGENVEGSCDGDVVQKGKRRKHIKHKKERSLLPHTLCFRARNPEPFIL